MGWEWLEVFVVRGLGEFGPFGKVDVGEGECMEG